jgi:hypothetical protein
MKFFLSLFFKVAVAVFAIVGILFTAVFFAMQFDLLNVRGSIAERNIFFFGSTTTTLPGVPCEDSSKIICGWNETPEWAVIKEGLMKDAPVIARVSRETGISQRMIAAVVVPEQTRFFTANRELFKRYFEPLKLLGSLTQFSLGISGIKEETAKDIEEYTASSSSPFYPGENMAELVAYEAYAGRDAQLYDRLTDARDHYYSYLYTALLIKEVEAQWRAAGFDIAQNPEVVATLFNIGFAGSHPNASPKTGGAPIATGGKIYNYGELGANFYRSDELTNIFPK